MKILRTTLGLSSVAAGATAAYAYYNPEILPLEARNFLGKYDIIKKESLYNETSKFVGKKSSKKKFF